MRLAFHLLSLLALLAVCVHLTLNPSRPYPVEESRPLLRPAALGEKQESILSRAEREQEFRSMLGAAFPAGGRPIRNRFSDADLLAAPAFAGFPALHAPQDLRAVEQEGGVRLSWRPHPQNPVRGLQYRVERWNQAGQLEAQWVQDSLERLDHPGCEGVPYAYRVSTQLERELELGDTQQTLVRRSPPIRTSVRLERRSNWVAELRDRKALWLTLRRPGSPDQGPFEAIPGESLGNTSWIVESWTKAETEVVALARSPRFDELGRRVVVDGQAASRVREEPRIRSFATLSLLDPCGHRLRENLFLAEEAPR
jgi:hypothetical protein